MTDFQLNVEGVFDAFESHGLKLGVFESVNKHEPKSAPGNGQRLVIWTDAIVPLARVSGLAATSALVTYYMRIYSNMLQEPQDAIDPNMMTACALLFSSLNADFDLGENASHIDLLGAYGQPMSAQAGYLNQDQRLYRVMTISVPVVFNDVWTQEA